LKNREAAVDQAMVYIYRQVLFYARVNVPEKYH
jgi:hypothetical protein